ncbi:MAG: universal stress protein [Dehalococcoidales bacterium]|nr:universal stress protein [Dehalococcoidales bacterium]
MYKKMLIPLDGSELAEIVLSYATELAGRLDLEVSLIHVCEPSSSDSEFMCRAYIERVAEKVSDGSREVHSSTGLSSGNKAVEATGSVITGHPAEEIISYAKDNDVDFILMATHGRSGVKRWVMGSVADKVLRASPVPVWLVRAAIPEKIIREEWHNRTLLVPLDGSELAESVIPHVESLAKQRSVEKMRIVLLRVAEDPFVTADYPYKDWEEHVKRTKEHFKQGSKTYLEGLQQRLIQHGLIVDYKVLQGNPADEIIKYSHGNLPNLVIMATHGRSGIGRWEYGSVADKVLHGVSSPIFLVRQH